MKIKNKAINLRKNNMNKVAKKQEEFEIIKGKANVRTKCEEVWQKKGID